MIALMFFLVAAVAFCFFMLARNEWVYKVRMRVLWEESREEYESLPGYEVMLNRFWIWDVEKFKR